MAAELENHVKDMLPAYVLDSLTDEEMSQVAEHLSGCQTCQAELARLQLVADDLPLAVMQTAPPTRVKQHLMEAIHSRQVQARPIVRPSSARSLADILRARLPIIGLALIVLLTLGNLLLWRQVNVISHQVSTPMRIVALANTKDAPQAIGTLIMNQTGEYGTLVVDNLASLGATHQYQVWMIRDGEHTSGGVFSVNPSGYASLEIMASMPLVSYDSIGISIEPYGGSPSPTGARVLGGAIPH